MSAEVEPARLLCWGCGDFGQHGHGVLENVDFDTSSIENLGEVKFMDCGSSHTVIVTADDRIFSWGNNNSGQLGLGDTESALTPSEVFIKDSPDCSIAGIACGGRHTMIWFYNGYVYSFGNNFYAQLGYNFNNERYRENQLFPHLLSFLTHRSVEQVSCGDKHSLFLFHDGAIAAVGCNLNGQIGSGDNMEAVVPKLINVDMSIKSIASGANHNLAITATGGVLMWGYGKACGNRKRDILSPETVPFSHPVVQVACGSSHSMILTESGSVYTWGSGIDGQLGHPDLLYLALPRKVKDTRLLCNTVLISGGESFSAAVTRDGQLYLWGQNSDVIDASRKSQHKQFIPLPINSNPCSEPIQAIQCGGWHVVAVTGMPKMSLRLDIAIETSSGSDNEDESLLDAEKYQRTEENIEAELQNHSLDEPECEESHKDVGMKQSSGAILPQPPSRTYTRQTIGEFYSSSTPEPPVKNGVLASATAFPRQKTKRNNKNHVDSPKNSETDRRIIHKKDASFLDSSHENNDRNGADHITTDNNSTKEAACNSEKPGTRLVQNENKESHSKNSRQFQSLSQTFQFANNYLPCQNENTNSEIDEESGYLSVHQPAKPNNNEHSDFEEELKLKNILPEEEEDNHEAPKDNVSWKHDSRFRKSVSEDLNIDLSQLETGSDFSSFNTDVCMNSKPKSTKISMDFVPPSKSEVLQTDFSRFRARTILAQRELSILDVDDLQVKRNVGQNLKTSTGDVSACRENLPDHRSLHNAMLPQHSDQKVDTSVHRIPIYRENTKTRIVKKPPIAQRPGTLLANESSSVQSNERLLSRRVQNCWTGQEMPPVRQNFKTVLHRNKIVYSSGASWQNRENSGFALHKSSSCPNTVAQNKIPLKNSPAFPVTEKRLNVTPRKPRTQSTSATMRRRHPHKLLQRKLSS